MFTWYWLADVCAAEGIAFVLGHALAMKAIHIGSNRSCDRSPCPPLAQGKCRKFSSEIAAKLRRPAVARIRPCGHHSAVNINLGHYPLIAQPGAMTSLAP
jgi:hypothetical protein